MVKRQANQFSQFGLCLNNEGYAASLEVGKVYRVIRDDDAAVHGYIRVIDESSIVDKHIKGKLIIETGKPKRLSGLFFIARLVTLCYPIL